MMPLDPKVMQKISRTVTLGVQEFLREYNFDYDTYY